MLCACDSGPTTDPLFRPAAGELIPIEIEGAARISRSIAAIYRQGRTLSPTAMSFLALIRSTYGGGAS